MNSRPPEGISKQLIDLTIEEPQGQVAVHRIKAKARIQGVLSLALLVFSTMMMVLRAEPFASWYYALAWWPFIALMDAIVLWRKSDSLFWRNPRGFVLLAALSVPSWLVFEAFNLALKNWYYVGASPNTAVRWIGYVVCFATVIPAILEASELLYALGIAKEINLRPMRLTKPSLAGSIALGTGFSVLSVVVPQYAFPLVWLAVFLILEPCNYMAGEDSLFKQWEEGRFGTTIRLLGGGLLCGIAWELFNFNALCKWIYTVPFFEEGKLFEMPFAGFLGFPPFALECYAIVHFARGVARRLTPSLKVLTSLGLTILSLFMFHLVDRETVNSLQPLLRDLADLAPQEARILEQAGIKRLDLWILKPGARAKEALVLELLGATPEVIAKWRALAAMSALKGMGTANLRLMILSGVDNLKKLAEADPKELARRLSSAQFEKGWARQVPREAQVRLWVREAKKACSDGPEPALPGCK